MTGAPVIHLATIIFSLFIVMSTGGHHCCQQSCATLKDNIDTHTDRGDNLTLLHRQTETCINQTVIFPPIGGRAPVVAANEEAVPVSPHRMGTAGTVWAHMFPVVGDGLACNAGTAHTLRTAAPLLRSYNLHAIKCCCPLLWLNN